jgi:hypothetical protein
MLRKIPARAFPRSRCLVSEGDYGNRGHPPNQSSLRRSLFSAMAVAILASVFVGFAKSYYLAGVFKAPLPNLLIHIHCAVFSSWILLLIVQTSLVGVRKFPFLEVLPFLSPRRSLL